MKKTLIISLSILLLAGCSFGNGKKQEVQLVQENQPAQKQEVPEVEKCSTIKEGDFALYYKYKFNDYSVLENNEKPSAPLNLKSHPRGLQFRTLITKEYKNGPNFAGHYTVVQWGCGTGCQNLVIVDNLTGNILKGEIGSSYGIEYKKDSRLLIAMDPVNWLDNFGCAEEIPLNVNYKYYEMQSDKAVLAKIPETEYEEVGKKVVLYGSLRHFSTSGSMKFYYEDDDYRKPFSTKDRAWFWGYSINDNEKDDEFIDYVAENGGSIFKIVGIRDEDDCGYIGDGTCIENIGIEKIEIVK